MMSYVIGPVGPKFSPTVSKEISKENCKQDFEFPAKTMQSNKRDCRNNVTSNEKEIELDSNFLSNFRVKNMDSLLKGNLNKGSMSNKFDQLRLFVWGKTDILVITKTKLDSTFPTSQLLIEGYSEPYRFDRNMNGGGVLIHVLDDMPSKPVRDYKLPLDTEGIFVKLNLIKNKWLLFGSYNPPSQSDEYFFNHVENGLDIYSRFCDKYLFFCNFFSK